MRLREINIKPYYNKANEDIAKEFYYPCMAASKLYERATGYFGSTIYILSWGCLKEFINNGGKIRIICSPYLSKTDQEAIEEGISALSSEELKDNLWGEFQEIFSKKTLTAPERVLACLIAMNQLEIKVAVGKQDVNRLFHDKVGVFYDAEDAVAFRGSINETFKGISNDGNFESFDAFTSWGEYNDVERLNGIKNDFNTIWENRHDKIQTLELPNSIKSLIQTHARKESHWVEALEEVTASIDKSAQWSADKKPGGKRPRKHQLDALEAWDKNGRKGILEHATGSGKTFSAMCAIRKEIERNHPVLVLVPSVGLLQQWHKELSEVFNDIDIKYLLCGGGNSYWKERTMLKTFTRPGVEIPRITIAVMGTAVTEEFRNKMYQSDELMVVADEVHRMGSLGNRQFFSVRCGARLGLSATPRRYNDPDGTNAILDFFGGLIPPPYTLEDAINAGVLCKYFYHPNVVNLTEDEQNRWDDISNKISIEYAKLITKHDEVSILNNDRLKMMLLQRARIVKNARNKIKLAVDILCKNYKDNHRWIVYCDNQGQMRDVLNEISAKELRVYEYHSNLPDESRRATLKSFEQIGGIIVSIRCLDEGIDIPSTTHALILASSQNPREFIQRRGRILRLSGNKHFAYLYDTIVIPNDFAETDKQDKIVQTELARAIQFGEWSEDQACIVHLKTVAIDNNLDYNQLQTIGVENDE